LGEEGKGIWRHPSLLAGREFDPEPLFGLR
jgi:hypothetical protein